MRDGSCLVADGCGSRRRRVGDQRPEAPKHAGISMFIVPLDAPGVTIRPVFTFAGWRTNESFFDEVRVPSDALICYENPGWYIAANALDYERVSIGGYNQLALGFEQF